MPNISFQWCRLTDFTSIQLHTVIAAREAVFIVEQDCSYQDADELDHNAWHLVAWSDGVVAAYLRVVDPGIKYKEPSIGRVLTTKLFRGAGLGKRITAEGIARTKEEFPGLGIRISAQAYLRGFYENYGFKVVSDEYLEDDIPHVEMVISPN